MTLDELIARLNELKQIEAGQMGKKTVVLQAPMADVDCWIHADQVNYVLSSDADGGFIRIQGGIGA